LTHSDVQVRLIDLDIDLLESLIVTDVSESGRSVGVLKIRHELDVDHIDEVSGTPPVLVAVDTVCTGSDGGSHGSSDTPMPDADAWLVSLGDDGGDAAPAGRHPATAPDAALAPAAGPDHAELAPDDRQPARLVRHRWFRPAVEGIDVGLDLFPFEPETGPGPEADWHPPVESPAAAVHSDEAALHSDEAVLHFQEVAVHSEGTAVHSDEAVLRSEEAAVHSEEAVLHSEEAAAHPREPEQRTSLPGAMAEPVGSHRSRRMRTALIGIMSLAVLNMGASLGDSAGAPRRSPAPAGNAASSAGPNRPEMPQNHAVVGIPAAARRFSLSSVTGTGPLARP
jgi:hypothetical protein